MRNAIILTVCPYVRDALIDRGRDVLGAILNSLTECTQSNQRSRPTITNLCDSFHNYQ